MISREWLKKIRHLELRTVRLVEDLMAGPWHSVFKGRGMDFDEVRGYQPGDEVRRIDWNVTARTGVPHIKKYIEEREMTVMLVIDISASGLTGSVSLSKRELAAEIAAVLAFSAVRNNDKVGALLFSSTTERFIRPAKGRRHALRLIGEVLSHPPAGTGTDVALALRHLNHAVSRRAVVFVISDFMDRGFERALKVTGRRHDLIAVTVTDPSEEALPDLGWITFEDAETGNVMEIHTGHAKSRASFAAAAARRREDLLRLFRRAGLDVIGTRTDQPWLHGLMRFFETRLRRLQP